MVIIIMPPAVILFVTAKTFIVISPALAMLIKAGENVIQNTANKTANDLRNVFISRPSPKD